MVFHEDDKGANQTMKTFLKKRPRRFGWRVTGKVRKRMAEAEPREPRRKGDYLLAPCIVLAATVYGTRQAYHAAMAYLPWARSYDFKNV